MSMLTRRYSEGYITLLSVVVFGAVSVAIVTTILFLGSQSLSNARDHELYAYGNGAVDVCVEEALEQIRNSDSFSGGNSISLANGACSYTVLNTGGENRTVIASSTTGTIVRKVQVTLDQINPTIHITNWSDVN